MTGMVAPMVLGGPINGDWFEAYVAQVLVPELRPGDIVIMDSCRCGTHMNKRLLQPTARQKPTFRIVEGFRAP